MKSEMNETNNTACYNVHTKQRQEGKALENLQNQGFTSILPTMQVQKLCNQPVQLAPHPCSAATS